MKASVSRTKLIAALATAAFSTATATAHADVMTAGTWDGEITGGTLTLGDGDLHDIAVPAGDSFTFTVPDGGAAPVTFKAPATHVPIPLMTVTEAGNKWSAAGNLDISPIVGTIDPTTGAVAATAGGHGILHLDFASGDGSTSSLYCHLGNAPATANDPAAPAPFDLALGGTWSAGSATLADTAFAVVLDCGFPVEPDPLKIIGTPTLPGSSLTLTAAFTRRADPPPPTIVTTTKPPATTTTPKATETFTPAPVRCVVPKLKGLKLKKARKAAKRAHCKVKVKRKTSRKTRTKVLKQSKAAGTVLAKGARIRLTVAK